MKLLEHGLKVVEMVFEKKLCVLVTVNKMKFGSMSERGTIDAVFILRRIKEEHHAKGKKVCMFFVDLGKAFERVPMKGQ